MILNKNDQAYHANTEVRRDGRVSDTQEFLPHVMQAFYELEIRVGQLLNHSSTQYYPYVPYTDFRFCQILKELKDLIPHDAPTFVDVGCGIGTKVFLARRLEFDAHGIDFHQKYVEFADSFVGNCKCHDGLTFPDYGKFDVIYYFNPIADREKALELEEKIFRDAKVGAFIFNAMPRFYLYKQDKLNEFVWKKTDRTPSQIHEMKVDFDVDNATLVKSLKEWARKKKADLEDRLLK